MIACRKQFTDTLLELAREDKDIVAVTTDARGSVHCLSSLWSVALLSRMP